jgi:hypothetical protein
VPGVVPDIVRDAYQFTVHFYDSSHTDIAQIDGLAWRGRYWREGDTVIKRLCLPADSNPGAKAAGARIGMYVTDGKQFFGQDLLDETGRAVNSGWLDIPFSLN